MNFALIGAAGFVAPRHMRAIKETDNELIAAHDVNDSVGILDSYFPEAEFYTNRYDFRNYLIRHPVDYISIATPSINHEFDIFDSLMLGANVICEKPLVLNYENLIRISQAEKMSKKRIFNILQLRLHPNISKLKINHDFHEVKIDYITPRGKWYFASWKSDAKKSGGLLMNIGIHIFDMLLWLFGPSWKIENIEKHDDHASGILDLEKAHIQWRLSIRTQDSLNGNAPYRHMIIDGNEIDFSDGFLSLHTESYKRILSGKGFGIDDAEPALRLVRDLQNA